MVHVFKEGNLDDFAVFHHFKLRNPYERSVGEVFSPHHDESLTQPGDETLFSVFTMFWFVGNIPSEYFQTETILFRIDV